MLSYVPQCRRKMLQTDCLDHKYYSAKVEKVASTSEKPHDGDHDHDHGHRKSSEVDRCISN